MAGQEISLDEERGLGHGAWVLLMLMYGSADVPVTQLSVLTQGGPSAHLALGRTLAPLRAEGVLILGSGGAVHSLREWRAGEATVPAWAQAFDDWLAEMIEANALDDLVAYRERHPKGARPCERGAFSGALRGGGHGWRGAGAAPQLRGLSMAAYAFGG